MPAITLDTWLFSFLHRAALVHGPTRELKLSLHPNSERVCRSRDEPRYAVTRIVPIIESREKAPDFTLPDQDGRPVKLSGFRGQPVVVYFYPKADTPGCTTQACGVRDHRADYDGAGAVVLGISPDPVAKVKRFHDKHDLGFALLADEDHAVAESYGVWAEKSMYGRKFWGVQRATFVIDQEGVLAHVIPKVSPATHDEQVLQALGLLSDDLSGPQR